MKKPQHWHQWLLIALGLSLVILILLVPLLLIFSKALSGGLTLLWGNLNEDYMLHAIGLTLMVAAMTVPINLVFGVLLAWCITHYATTGDTA